MGLFVNTNTASLTSQRNLNNATRSLGQSFQRLSSVFVLIVRKTIPPVAISERMTTQVRGITRQFETPTTVYPLHNS